MIQMVGKAEGFGVLTRCFDKKGKGSKAVMQALLPEMIER